MWSSKRKSIENLVNNMKKQENFDLLVLFKDRYLLKDFKGKPFYYKVLVLKFIKFCLSFFIFLFLFGVVVFLQVVLILIFGEGESFTENIGGVFAIIFLLIGLSPFYFLWFYCKHRLEMYFKEMDYMKLRYYVRKYIKKSVNLSFEEIEYYIESYQYDNLKTDAELVISDIIYEDLMLLFIDWEKKTVKSV
jgi:hypothetical protein